MTMAGAARRGPGDGVVRSRAFRRSRGRREPAARPPRRDPGTGVALGRGGSVTPPPGWERERAAGAGALAAVLAPVEDHFGDAAHDCDPHRFPLLHLRTPFRG